MVVLPMLNRTYDFRGKKFLVTGHTGFKGTWLSRTLVLAGAEVHGLALAPEPSSIFLRVKELGIRSSSLVDIRNSENVRSYFLDREFNGVFHLAAQPLVLESYEKPIQTFETNVMGTAHLLDCIINKDSAPWVLVITSDKVYKNIEVEQGYKEDDALGGKDPYSASKSATEMVVNAWRAIAEYKGSKVKLCVARAGNVIGGGDLAQNRLIPDLIRSFHANIPAVIRNPNSVRPWQHVLDPINGYLRLAKQLNSEKYTFPAYNFGPAELLKLNVESVAKIACSIWGKNAGYVIKSDAQKPSESVLLWISSQLAQSDLGWQNHLSAPEAIKWAINWELETKKTDAKTAMDTQIRAFFEEYL